LQFSHIVAIKTSGNVFSHEAVSQFNIKMKCWTDLLTDDHFTKADIIQIQRPNTPAGRSTEDFDHVKRDLKATDEDTGVIRNSNHTLEKVLAQQGKPGSAPTPSSKRELALAQLEAALRKKRLAKSHTAAHKMGTQSCSMCGSWVSALTEQAACKLIRAVAALGHPSNREALLQRQHDCH
jgi:peptidyl-prolyl cis-trans isomerase-like 2